MNYEFKNNIRNTDKCLICPECSEELSYVDIESYAACPFCDCPLEKNVALEDFILQPVIDRWASQYRSAVKPATTEQRNSFLL